MATWTNIDDTFLEPGKPARSVDGLALRDNPVAIAEGAAGAPRVKNEGLDEYVAYAGSVASDSRPTTAAFWLVHTGLFEGTHTGTSERHVLSFYAQKNGQIRVGGDLHRSPAGVGSTRLQIRKNGAIEVTLSSGRDSFDSLAELNHTMTVQPGDLIEYSVFQTEASGEVKFRRLAAAVSGGYAPVTMFSPQGNVPL